MALFIISEAFLFGSLFWTYYYLRLQSGPHWPPEGVHLALGLVSLNTVILLSSSPTMHLATLSVRRNDRRALLFWLPITILLGTTFLGITLWEWVHAPFRPWSHAYGSIFFTLTGFHALHVLGGLFVLLALWVRALRGRISKRHHLDLEVGGLYWHFVDFVWIFVYTTIFWVR